MERAKRPRKGVIKARTKAMAIARKFDKIRCKIRARGEGGATALHSQAKVPTSLYACLMTPQKMRDVFDTQGLGLVHVCEFKLCILGGLAMVYRLVEGGVCKCSGSRLGETRLVFHRVQLSCCCAQPPNEVQTVSQARAACITRY